MSAVASWSYTATATLWRWLGRDDWSGKQVWSPPDPIACDYSAESRRATDASGVEFTTRQVIYTEAEVKQGDRILIGACELLDPVAAGALEVRAVTRNADTFDRVADDFTAMT